MFPLGGPTLTVRPPYPGRQVTYERLSLAHLGLSLGLGKSLNFRLRCLGWNAQKILPSLLMNLEGNILSSESLKYGEANGSLESEANVVCKKWYDY